MGKFLEVNKTKVGLPSNGKGLLAKLSNTLERCFCFIIVDSDQQEEVISILNYVQIAARGAGTQAAQSLIDHRIEIVIIPQIDCNALNMLLKKGIGIYLGIEGTIKENIEAFNQKRLVKVKLSK